MVTMLPLADYVVRRLLNERGSQRMYRRTLDVPDNPAAAQALASIDHALRAAALALTEDRTEADTRSLSEDVARLKRDRLAARTKAGAAAVERMAYVGTVQQVWDLCTDDDQRHEVLTGQIETLIVSKGVADGRFHSTRVELTWSAERKPTVPEAISVGPIHRRMRELHPWISIREASRLPGSSESIIKGGIKRGQIAQRKIHRAHPSLERTSVIAFLRDRNLSG
jgi:hypothetical protein